MRKTLLFLTLLCTKLTFAQLNDNFADGDFTNNPVWGGGTGFFKVEDGVLKSNGPTTGTSSIALSTPNALAVNTVWEFYFKLDFNPTATNQLRVYLVSNQADLTGALQGYFFQIGETGNNDGLHLYRQNGTSTSQIITGAQKIWASTSVTSARIKITRDNAGNWQLYSDVNGGTNYVFEGAVPDATYTTTTHFGVNPRYNTVARATQFSFDDFSVSVLPNDVTPPTLLSTRVVDSKTLELTFNEPLNTTVAQTVTNYNVSNGAGNPVAATMGSLSNVVNLSFANDFILGASTLAITNIADAKGNVAATFSRNFTYIKPYIAQRGDVVINEIFADPAPVIGLPEKEFIELYNTTNEYIIITGWRYKDATTSTATLAADTLAPKEYRILCANADVALFKPFGKTMGLGTWPSLNNDGDNLTLFLADGTTVIDNVEYADTWYRDDVKKAGGYSLELVNSLIGCSGAARWKASVSTIGGTPGTQNSVYEAQLDLTAPKLLSTDVLSSTKVILFFDLALDASTLTNLSNYIVNNSVGSPIEAVVGFDNKSVTLTFATAFARGLENTIIVQSLTSCAGTVINSSNNSATIFYAKEIKPNDILISEILFNERTGGAEFVEVFNPTDDILDLKDLQISNASYTGANDKKLISTTSVFIKPKTYWVLSRNPDAVKQQYEVVNPLQMIQVAALPTYTNTAGSAKLWKGDELIDDLSYAEKMHHALLKDVKGVSLERVSFIKNGSELGNLQSAAASVGFATPTYKNSQSEDTSVKNTVTVANKTFSPDNDGFEDLLNIDYKFKENGNLATINIYTDKGILVRRLARNITMSTQGTINWDGLNDGGQLCKVGLYVIKIDTFHVNGAADSFKQTCVLASKLN